jgi:LmbE family N-acetylglucosaminyl deacetylase
MNRVFEDGRPGRVLAIGAHPDDLEVGAGGLLARMAKEGAEVTMSIISIPNRFEQRYAEALAGARVLGGRVVLLVDDKECRVEDVPMHDLVARLDGMVASTRPDLVITHSAHDLHWDHGLVNRATVSALRRTPCDLLAFLSSPEMNAQSRAMGQCFADISGTIDAKIESISVHKSQLPKLDIDSSRDLARAMGRISGFAFAEAYEVLRVRI